MSFQSLMKRFEQWMRGRNGVDELSNASIALSLLLTLINLFAHSKIVSVLALVLALYACFRMSSKGVNARRRENRAFVKRLGPAAKWLRVPSAQSVEQGEQSEFKHLTCPECGQKMRVPRGKGKMRVTCPRCQTKFDTES